MKVSTRTPLAKLMPSVQQLAATLLVSGAAMAATMAQAEVTLMVDDYIKVTAINGQEVSQSPFQKLKKEFTLAPGQHVITARYDRLYEFTNDSHDFLRSGNVSVAAQMQDNQTYRLTMPNQPEDYEDAKDFAKQPTLAVQQGNTVISEQQASGKSSGGIFTGIGNTISGMFGGGDSATESNQKAIAALDQTTTTQATQAVAQSGVNANGVYQPIQQQPVTTTVSQSTDKLDQFMQLWLNATPEERAKIRQWVAE